jgi:hypothetical protein
MRSQRSTIKPVGAPGRSVYRYLVNRVSIPALHGRRLRQVAPDASNETEAGRAQNRRVELIPSQGERRQLTDSAVEA